MPVCRARLESSTAAPDTDVHVVIQMNQLSKGVAPASPAAGLLALPVPSPHITAAGRKAGVQFHGLSSVAEGETCDVALACGDSPVKPSPRRAKSRKIVSAGLETVCVLDVSDYNQYLTMQLVRTCPELLGCPVLSFAV